MFNLILFFKALWQSPQMLLGSILFFFFEKTKVEFDSTRQVWFFIVKSNWFPGVSLWPYIFLNEKIDTPVSRKHEFGHCVQSLWLGPFYLLIIGLPSLCFNIFNYLRHGSKKDYYGFYTEDGADSLGGVTQKEEENREKN